MPFFLLIFLILPFLPGCASAPLEVITCTPPHADIYWGQSPTELKKTGYKTPFSREISGSEWEPWCYQVKKDGYHDSHVVCRDKEKSRYINFNLDPLMPTTPPEPESAAPDRVPAEEKEKKTEQVAPESERLPSKEVSRKADSPQVKKEVPQDTKIVSKPQVSEKQKAPYIPKPQPSKVKEMSSEPKPQSSREQAVPPKPKAPENEYLVSGPRLTLTWDDQSSDEQGFEIERKEGAEGEYRKIGTVGPNVTEYTDSGLKPGTVYYYRVRAYNAKGLYSAYAAEIRVKTTPQ